jgi:hypothetical protein
VSHFPTTAQPDGDARPQGDFALDRGAGHEPSEIGIRGIFLFGAVLVVSAVVILIFLAGVMRWFSREEKRLETLRPPQYSDERGQYPTPQLQSNPSADMQEFARREADEMRTYGWVDRKAGIAHIPIDRAIDILAEKGLPARGQEATKSAPKGAKSD